MLKNLEISCLEYLWSVYLVALRKTNNTPDYKADTTWETFQDTNTTRINKAGWQLWTAFASFSWNSSALVSIMLAFFLSGPLQFSLWEKTKGLKILFRFQSLFHWYIAKINLVNGWKGERQGEGVYQKVLQKSIKYSNTPRSWKC